ncbi:unnamed protein product [Boreogadus saida]
MALPVQFKAVQHHLRTAQEHDKRDPVVAYYCRLYAMQTGMKLDSKTPECRKFLVKLMDQLETMKKELGDNESVGQEVVGNAHIENYALKMFLYADNEDRAGSFHKAEAVDENEWNIIVLMLLYLELPSGRYTDEEEGADGGFYDPGPSSGGSFRGPQPQVPPDQGALGPGGPAPGIGFTPGPGPGPMGPPVGPGSNYNNIHIPPGAHAPANTPAELPPAAGGPERPMPLPRSMPSTDPALLSATQEVQIQPRDMSC